MKIVKNFSRVSGPRNTQEVSLHTLKTLLEEHLGGDKIAEFVFTPTTCLMKLQAPEAPAKKGGAGNG